MSDASFTLPEPAPGSVAYAFVLHRFDTTDNEMADREHLNKLAARGWRVHSWQAFDAVQALVLLVKEAASG